MHAESHPNVAPDSFAESHPSSSLNRTPTNTGIDSGSFFTDSKRGDFCGQPPKQPFKCPPGGAMPPHSRHHPAQPVLRQAATRPKRGATGFLLCSQGGKAGQGAWTPPRPRHPQSPRTPPPHTASALRPGIRWQVPRQPASGPRQALCHAPCWRGCLHQNRSLRPASPHNPRRGVRGTCGGRLDRPKKQFCLFTPKKKAPRTTRTHCLTAVDGATTKGQ